jgi:hypothetical protein
MNQNVAPAKTGALKMMLSSFLTWTGAFLETTRLQPPLSKHKVAPNLSQPKTADGVSFRAAEQDRYG